MHRILLFLGLAHRVAAHGWVTDPVSKNEMAVHHYQNGMPDDFRYEPQTCYWGNTAGHEESGGGSSCGAKDVAYTEGLSTWQKWYDSAGVAVPTISPGEVIKVHITITADHGGQSWLTLACGDHIGEDVKWTYLERAQDDRDHHFMPSNPGIYAWATSEAASRMNSKISASWVVPKNFSCPTSHVVGRWLWKTGSSCNDFKNIGRPTQTFSKDEFATVVKAYSPSDWVKIQCVAPPETFISCLDFQLSGSPSPPGPPSPPTPTPPPSPAPTPPPSPSKPKTPTCCWSNWGDDSTCGQYTGPGGQCNTGNKKCNSNGDCPKGDILV